jgi:hypothetical protein
MQSCANIKPYIWLLALCAFGFTAQAQEDSAPRHFTVLHADTSLVNGVYVLNARVDYSLSEAVVEALHSGVTLTLLVEIEVERARDLLWDAGLTSLSQRYELRYHALTRQYLVKNLNTGVQQAFPSQEAALSDLGEIKDVPLLDEHLLTPGANYNARLRARLDHSKLPTPLRLTALLSAAWQISSEWYTWHLQR